MRLLSVRSASIERGGRKLLANMSLDVAGGDIWELKGPNGIGKTSFLRALAGLSSIEIDGEITCHTRAFYLGHASAIKRELSPLNNLLFHPSCEASLTREVVCQALKFANLQGLENQPVKFLSNGQQRRVSLARLIISSSKLWLLDEPFVALDSAGCDWLAAVIQRHVDSGGGLVFSNHQSSSLFSSQKDFLLTQYVDH